MGTLWDLLRDNPILLFVLLAWVAGAVGNVLRSQKKAKEQDRLLITRLETPLREGEPRRRARRL